MGRWNYLINFSLPGMYENYKLNMVFLLFAQQYPQYFKENVNIEAIYGNFYFCSWDGGRIFNRYKHATKEIVERFMYIYNYFLQTPIRFIFTNSALTLTDCYDRFNNMVLDVCNNGMNEIVVNSEILEAYLRETFPSYKFISSTTKCLCDKNMQHQELNKNYYLICLDYNLNKDIPFLNSLSETEKEKSEILINALCPSQCPLRKFHYGQNSDYALSYGKPYTFEGCKLQGSSLNPDYCDLTNNLTPEEVIKYNSNGFSHFKLEGRTLSDIEMLCQYVKYLIKPEYQLYTITLVGQAIKNFDINSIEKLHFEEKDDKKYGNN